MTIKPVFIFSAGWRSGSTLLQRMLTASNELLIWGEAGGALDCLAEADLGYQQMLAPGNKVFRQGLGGNGEQQFVEFCKSDKEGVHRWIPCMNAPLDIIRDGFKAFLQDAYQKPAAKLGYTRWGVKEVRSGLATANFLRELYPDAKFVFLVRNPFDCLSSLKRHNWMDRPQDKRALEYYAQHWARLASEFRNTKFGMLLRYEDIISNTGTVIELQNYLELSHLDLSFIANSKVKGGVKSDSTLSWRECNRAKKIVKSEMQQYEY
jgi:hypothetical protein